VATATGLSVAGEIKVIREIENKKKELIGVGNLFS
jgi:hypothetical protein